MFGPPPTATGLPSDPPKRRTDNRDLLLANVFEKANEAELGACFLADSWLWASIRRIL